MYTQHAKNHPQKPLIFPPFPDNDSSEAQVRAPGVLVLKEFSKNAMKIISANCFVRVNSRVLV